MSNAPTCIFECSSSHCLDCGTRVHGTCTPKLFSRFALRRQVSPTPSRSRLGCDRDEACDSFSGGALAERPERGSGERESRPRRTDIHRRSSIGSAHVRQPEYGRDLLRAALTGQQGSENAEPGISCQADGAGLTGRKRNRP
jgi:hypothetical protein